MLCHLDRRVIDLCRVNLPLFHRRNMFALEYHEDIYKKGLLAEGRAEGRVEGLAEGENRLASLITKLFSAGRKNDVERVSTDKEFRGKLYSEYGL